MVRKRNHWQVHLRSRAKRWSLSALFICVALFAWYRRETSWSKLESGSTESQDERRWNVRKSLLEGMIWSRQPKVVTNDMIMLREILGDENVRKLQGLCGRTLYHSIQNVVVSRDQYAFFSTGDLPLMWIRDSAFQMGVLIPKMGKRRALRNLIEGGIRMQAFYILQDPYANGYYPEWRDPAREDYEDRYLGRGGWVGTRNYELDSGCFFISLLWDYYNSEEYGVDLLIREPIIFDAVQDLVDMWIIEQNHDKLSRYSFPELPNDGLGRHTAYTGMIWSAFRPSDDANMYGYSIPSNMFAASSLEKAIALNTLEWKNGKLSDKMTTLLSNIEEGIQKYGIVEAEQGVKVYAYEVDGFGNALVDFDDPNWPSLVSMPLLGWEKYDKSIYESTKTRLLSSKNKYFFKGGNLQGLGSPHTETNLVWALGIFSEALTSTSAQDKARHLIDLLKIQCNDGLMHESIDVDDLSKCTRKWFEWANALMVTVTEHLIGVDCDQAAQESHIKLLAHFERNNPMYDGSEGEKLLIQVQRHQGIIARVQHGGKYKKKVNDWQGLGFLM